MPKVVSMALVVKSVVGEKAKKAGVRVSADFYDEIDRHPETRRVLTGDQVQKSRLKQSLLGWLAELFQGAYDAAYVERRWRVGHRHVEIGLDQVFTNAALSRTTLRVRQFSHDLDRTE